MCLKEHVGLIHNSFIIVMVLAVQSLTTNAILSLTMQYVLTVSQMLWVHWDFCIMGTSSQSQSLNKEH